MYKIQLTDREKQEQTFALFNLTLRLTLYYNSISNSWMFDLYDVVNDKQITTMKGLSCQSPSLLEYGVPFILTLIDKSELGINPISKSDLINRFELFIIDKEAYREAIRQSYTAQDR